MINALTFDIEEYFHAEAFARVVDPHDWHTLESRVVSATERILTILSEARTVATFFVLGWGAERHPRLVRDIQGGGHEVACHGYGHQMITQLSRSDFAEDVRRGKAAVEEAAGAAGGVRRGRASGNGRGRGGGGGLGGRMPGAVLLGRSWRLVEPRGPG